MLAFFIRNAVNLDDKFRIKGLDAPQAEDSKHRIMFMKLHFLQSMASIAGIIVGSFLAIGGLVLFIVRLKSKGDGKI